jgi:hypothetical protein
MQRKIQYQPIEDAGKGSVAERFTRELAFPLRGSLVLGPETMPCAVCVD